MFPFRDHQKPSRFPFVTYSLIFINIVVFIFSISLGPLGFEEFYTTYGMIPELITSGSRLFTLFTSMFLHGGFMHILGNMLFLHVFGDNLEDRMGPIRFILFYIVCGLLASALQILVNPLSPVPNIGASGAIAGVMGGYLFLFPNAKVDVLSTFYTFRIITVSSFTMLGYWFVFQLISGVGSIGSVMANQGGVAYFAHIGGFIAGILLLIPIKLRTIKF